MVALLGVLEMTRIIRIDLEALPAALDADYRLKVALKVLLRRFGLRCHRVALVEEPKP